MRRTTTVHTSQKPSGPVPRSDRRTLRISESEDGAVVVTGDLDAASADVMDHALAEAEAVHDAGGPLVIDLHGVGFMDSSGLRTLVAASIRAQRRGTRVALRHVSSELSRLLEITGLRDQFGLTAAGPVDRAWQLSDAHVPRDDHPDRRRG